MRHDPKRWKADYDRDGYLVVEDVLDAELLAKLRSGVEAITRDPDRYPSRLKQHLDFERSYVTKEPHMNDLSAEQVGNALRNIMELPKFDPIFEDLIPHPPLLDVLETLFESPEFHFHNYKCIIKAPKVSSRFRWHRDLPYLNHTSPNLITAMLCLDDMTEANGATVVMPGSHRIEGAIDGTDMHIDDANLPDLPKVTVCCPAGSAVLFHVNIVHGGGANRSEIPRRNVIGIWAGPETYPITPNRYVFQGVYPRSRNPARQDQMRKSFPRVYDEGAVAARG